MIPKLLIVDDERGIVDMIQSYFQSQYDILTAYSGQEALQKAGNNPDLILLDINMPDIDGLTVCQKIRDYITCPILFLTARIESGDKIIGFQAGADDYIVKPFDLDELGARIAAHLRREQRRQSNSAVRFFGELALDYSARTATINSQSIPLSKREFEIVELLSLNAGQVFDRERIYELVWGLDGDGNSDTIMEHIRKIRAKFAAHTLLSTMMTTIVGQSLGVLTAMREQQAIALGGNRYATFLQMDADQLHALQQDERLSYGEEPLEFTSIEAGSTICVAGADLAVLETLDGYEGYLGIGNGGFTNGVQVIVDDSIYEQLTGKNTYSEFLPTLNKDVDRETFDTFVEDFCKQTPGTTFLSYEETDQQLQESFAQIQMLAWGLILFVGLIGILNIINTVYTNIHTRVTEIGMQRAIGMSASSLYKTFLWEGAYYGITASVIGSILGYICTIFIEAATSDTIQLVAIPVVSILEATLLAVGACLLATAIPLRKISNMSIVDSIETIE